MSYLTSIERVPVTLRIEEKHRKEENRYAITFYNLSNKKVATCVFSDIEVHPENKGNLFDLSSIVGEPHKQRMSLQRLLRIEKNDTDEGKGYLITFYDNDTVEKIGQYVFSDKGVEQKGKGNLYKRQD